MKHTAHIKEFFHHLFVPRESNNHRARLLHAQPLFLLVTMLLIINFFSPRIEKQYPEILGITANISIDELVNLTNQKRAESGLPALSLNQQLSQAASAKASHMFAQNYWAHTAPDGTTPWVFIKSAGYDYIFAGENLARGFTTATDAVNAWMESPGHRDNILSKNYSEIGFAVSTGTLTGDETVLIVEMFGSQPTSAPAVGGTNQSQIALAPTLVPTFVPQVESTIVPQPSVLPQAVVTPFLSPTLVPTIIPTTIPAAVVEPTKPSFVASINNEPLVSRNGLGRTVAVVIGFVFLLLFVIDMIVIEQKQIVRLVSHNLDHIMFLTIILLTILLFTKGAVL